MFDQTTLFMVFLMLCFAGIAAMFYFVMRSLDDVAREIKGERSQIVGALQSMESSLDILVKAAQVVLQRQNVQTGGQTSSQTGAPVQGVAATTATTAATTAASVRFGGQDNVDSFTASGAASGAAFGLQDSVAAAFPQPQTPASPAFAGLVSGLGVGAEELPSLSLKKQVNTRPSGGGGLSIKMD